MQTRSSGIGSPGDFAQRMARQSIRVKTKTRVIYEGARQKAFVSVVFGSEITGAPGQPVDTTALRTSWYIRNESPTSDVTATQSPYARQNEDGIARPGGGEYRLLSPVGGRWSVALTVAGWPRLVQNVAQTLGSATESSGSSGSAAA